MVSLVAPRGRAAVNILPKVQRQAAQKRGQNAHRIGSSSCRGGMGPGHPYDDRADTGHPRRPPVVRGQGRALRSPKAAPQGSPGPQGAMFRVMDRVRHSLWLAALALLAHCAPALVPRPAAMDPTQAQAEESPASRPQLLNVADPLLAIAAEPAIPPSAPDKPQPMPGMAPHMHHPAPASSTKPAQPGFTCAMHPEVHRDQPGSCPTCGMQLVSRETGRAP
jgi:hypothetical protein